MFKREIIQFKDIINELAKVDPDLAKKLWDEYQERKRKPRKTPPADILLQEEAAPLPHDTRFKVQFIDQEKVFEELKKLEQESK